MATFHFQVSRYYDGRPPQFWVAPRRQVGSLGFLWLALFSLDYAGQRFYMVKCWLRAYL